MAKLVVDSAGQLRERITLQKQSTYPDDYTGTAAEWQTVGTYWASVRPLIGRELTDAQEVHPQTTHRVTMRYDCCRDVKPSWRIDYNGRRLDINGVINENERNRWVIMDCVEHEVL